MLAEAGAVSRAELARRAALAPSTVSQVVGELAEAGLLVVPATTDAPARSGMGRPPELVALNRAAGVAVGIDFGKRHLGVVIADLAHNVLAERRRELDADMPAAASIAIAVELVEEVLAESGATREEVVGVGMGLPGPVHLPSGELGHSTILPGWVGVRATDAMESALGLPVEVGNDANLGALSEWMWGAGQGADDMVYVKVAHGIGAGLIVAGRPFVGASGTAGEIGHTVVDPGGSICRCGNRGCLETVAGAPTVLAALRDSYGEDLTIAEAVAKARAGDAGCARAIADAGRAVGVAVATLCNLVNPQRIVVGGDLGAAGEVLLVPLRESLRLSAIGAAVEVVEVVEGALGERAEVLGAVALVLRRGAALLTASRG